MLLITVTRLPKGFRILASSSYHTRYYCWSLYRNRALRAVISRSYQGESSVNFDLFEPLAPGLHELRVECFDWQPRDQTATFAYYMDAVPITRISVNVI